MKKRLITAANEGNEALLDEVIDILNVPYGEDTAVDWLDGMGIEKRLKRFAEEHNLEVTTEIEDSHHNIDFGGINIEVKSWLETYTFKSAGFFVRTVMTYLSNDALDKYNFSIPVIIGVHKLYN